MARFWESQPLNSQSLPVDLCYMGLTNVATFFYPLSNPFCKNQLDLM